MWKTPPTARASAPSATPPCGRSSREKRFSEIAVVGWHRDAKPEERGYAFPCGICRQFLREFAVPGMKVYVAVSEKEADIREYTLEQLLPESFGPEDLL